jgi:outer membrane biosynthesis protein TonB
MAFAVANRANLRRWAISAAIVALVHGAIVTAVVTWRKAIVPAEPPGPVVIELAPMPAPPTTDQAALAPAPAQVPSTTSPDKTPEKVEQKIEEKTAARGEEKAKPSEVEESPRVTAPVTLAPPESPEGANRADTKAVPGGAASGSVQAGGGGANPIDTRIGEQPRLRFKKAAKATDWTKAIMGRPSKNFARPQQPPSGMARNAIGMLVQRSPGATGANGSNAANGAKNAVGVTAMNTVGGAAASAVNGTATNAIGVSVAVRTRAWRTNFGQRGIGPLASNATLSSAMINGTGMIRSSSGTAVIGGPAKNVAGVINGTGMRPR